MYLLCVNVCSHRVTTQLQLINISYHITSYINPTNKQADETFSLRYLTYIVAKIPYREDEETGRYLEQILLRNTQ